MIKYFYRHLIFLLIVAIPVIAIIFELKTKQRAIANLPAEELTSLILPFDLGTPATEELTRTIKYRILQDLKINSNNNLFKINLGHFSYHFENQLVIGCQKFKFIEIALNAEGVAFSGDTPKIVFTYPCETPNNPEVIEMPEISFSEITLLPPTTKDWIDPKSQIHFYFISMSDSWPTQWSIFSITFFSPGIQEKLKISGAEIPAVLKDVPTILLE